MLYVCYQLFRIWTSDARFTNESLFWSKQINGIENESFEVISHTEIVTRYFIRQKTKHTLDEVDIKATVHTCCISLQSTEGNKTCKYLLCFFAMKQLFIACRLRTTLYFRERQFMSIYYSSINHNSIKIWGLFIYLFIYMGAWSPELMKTWKGSGNKCILHKLQTLSLSKWAKLLNT